MIGYKAAFNELIEQAPSRQAQRQLKRLQRKGTNSEAFGRAGFTYSEGNRRGHFFSR